MHQGPWFDTVIEGAEPPSVAMTHQKFYRVNVLGPARTDPPARPRLFQRLREERRRNRSLQPTEVVLYSALLRDDHVRDEDLRSLFTNDEEYRAFNSLHYKEKGSSLRTSIQLPCIDKGRDERLGRRWQSLIDPNLSHTKIFHPHLLPKKVETPKETESMAAGHE